MSKKEPENLDPAAQDAIVAAAEAEGKVSASQQRINELLIKKQLMENELLEYQLNELKLKIAKRTNSHIQVESDLADMLRNEKIRQEGCSHKKGGRGMEAVTGGGTDVNYCIIKHKMPNGDWFIMCTRCNKVWRPSDTDLVANEDWKAAMKFPTDNTASQSAIFMFVRGDNDRRPIRWGDPNNNLIETTDAAL